MAQQIINVGTLPNDKTGDPMRVAFQKTNDNFTEVYGKLQTKLVVPTAASDPILANSSPGQIYYNLTTGKFRGYNGILNQWENLN